ncbi:hypothetical protein T492DRAFT_1038839 [Pavlovales sp. CCMP2436]|nr:hypothetical protein T492DRAFT_1038839 [Pavlovales sp. CCMP2436]
MRSHSFFISLFFPRFLGCAASEQLVLVVLRRPLSEPAAHATVGRAAAAVAKPALRRKAAPAKPTRRRAEAPAAEPAAFPEATPTRAETRLRPPEAAAARELRLVRPPPEH